MSDAEVRPASGSDPGAGRSGVMIRRARIPLRIAMGMVAGVVVLVPLALGLPSLSLIGVGIAGVIGLSLGALEQPQLFRRAAHALYGAALAAVAYAVFVLELPSVITVYFPAMVLLAAANILGARAAIGWSIPCVALVAAGVYFEPATEREVSLSITFFVRAATLLTILGFGVSFRRSHDRQAAELTQHATTDALTGLPNRREFERALEEALERSSRFDRHGGLVFVDLDGVKKINDTLGHEAGDELLCAVAKRLGSHTRRVDTPARIGGDEFVVLLSEFDAPEAGELVATKLLGALREPLTLAGQPYEPSASIGVALFPEAATNPRDLLRLADDAMYQAKRAGGGRIFLRDDKGFRQVV